MSEYISIFNLIDNQLNIMNNFSASYEKILEVLRMIEYESNCPVQEACG
jgi:hypothetical protein